MSRKHIPAPVPNLHFVMIMASITLIIVSMVLYFFAPLGKGELFAGVCISAAGFLFGKFTNGFGKPLRPSPTQVNAIEDYDYFNEGEDK